MASGDPFEGAHFILFTLHPDPSIPNSMLLRRGGRALSCIEWIMDPTLSCEKHEEGDGGEVSAAGFANGSLDLQRLTCRSGTTRWTTSSTVRSCRICASWKRACFLNHGQEGVGCKAVDDNTQWTTALRVEFFCLHVFQQMHCIVFKGMCLYANKTSKHAIIAHPHMRNININDAPTASNCWQLAQVLLSVVAVVV